MCGKRRRWSKRRRGRVVAEPLGIGIVGMGFIGQTHARAFSGAASDGAPCRLRAVCDPDPDRRSGLCIASGNLDASRSAALFDPGDVRGYSDAADLMEDEAVELVCVCTPTDTHVDLAIRAIDAGKHVLIEKPIAISTSEIERLCAHAAGSDRLVIPAMCVRFWPGWSDLKAMVEDGRFGAVLHARFERLGGPPQWSPDFYADASRSGGAVFDLHVHDADFVRYLFGEPASVFSTGDRSHIQTQAIYPNGPAVSIEGGWLNDASFPFRMAFTVEFERAVVSFDSRRDAPLEIHSDGAVRRPLLGGQTGFDEQARAVCAAIRGPASAETMPTLADALGVTRFIEAELRSAASHQVVSLR